MLCCDTLATVQTWLVAILYLANFAPSFFPRPFLSAINAHHALLKQGKVLRLQKYDPTIDVDLPVSKADAYFALDFANHVITPLLGQEYVVCLVTIAAGYCHC